MKSLVVLLFCWMAWMQAATAQTTWQIDMMHSYVGFDVTYMEIIPFHGKFEQLEGQVVASKEDFSDMEINAKIPAASINTGSEKREKHLSTEDFFDMENHPYITFKSTKVQKIRVKKEEKLKVTGELTLRGVTKKVELIGYFTSKPVNDPWGHVKVGCSFRGTINRQDFGISYGQVLDSGALAINNEVEVVLDIVLMHER